MIEEGEKEVTGGDALGRRPNASRQWETHEWNMISNNQKKVLYWIIECLHMHSFKKIKKDTGSHEVHVYPSQEILQPGQVCCCIKFPSHFCVRWYLLGKRILAQKYAGTIVSWPPSTEGVYCNDAKPVLWLNALPGFVIKSVIADIKNQKEKLKPLEIDME